MRIVFFNFSTLNFGGGCEKNFMNLGKWFSNRGHEVSFITASLAVNRFYCAVFRQGKHKVNFSSSDLKNKFKISKYISFNFFDLILPTKKRKELKKMMNQATVVISKNELFEALLLKYFFRVKMSKVIFGFHTPLFYPATQSVKSVLHNKIYNSRFYFKLLKNAKVRCLVLTEHLKKILVDNNVDNFIKVIPNPIDTKKFSQKKYKKNEVFKLYFIGRMSEQKGIDTLASVIDRLSNYVEFNKMQFHFVGTGEQENILINLSKKFKNCEFHGFQTNIVHFYHDADLILVPSRWEGFPYAILEAQACGIPVITTNTSGCVDIVKNENTGWICEIDDINQIVGSITRAFNIWKNDFEEFIKIGKNARMHVSKNYGENIINDKLERFISQINAEENKN